LKRKFENYSPDWKAFLKFFAKCSDLLEDRALRDSYLFPISKPRHARFAGEKTSVELFCTSFARLKTSAEFFHMSFKLLFARFCAGRGSVGSFHKRDVAGFI
jgi:hypothetical protein